MAHYCPFDLFILVLCLMACVCAYGDVSEHGAREAVKEAKESANKVFQKAQKEVITAEELLNYINNQKINVEEAAKEAEESAKGNSEATSIAEKAQSALDGITELHPNATEQANKYINSAKDLKTKASTLVKDVNNLLSSSTSSTDYKKLKGDADAIKSQVELLENDINTAKSFCEIVSTKKWQMSNFVSAARLVKYQVDAIVAVSKFETLLKDSKRDVESTEKKRDEIDAIQKKMQELYDKSTSNLSSSYFSSLDSIVRGNLRTASHAFEDAQTSMKDMLQQKTQVDDALHRVNTATNDGTARSEANTVKWFVENAEKKVEKIKQALESVIAAAENALHRKNDLVNEINKNKNKPHDTKGKEAQDTPDTTKTHQTVQNTKEGFTESGTIKPTTINSDESINEQDVENTTESPVVSGTGKPTITKPTKPVSEGTDPTRHERSDSTMTVSVSLILALIASAALN